MPPNQSSSSRPRTPSRPPPRPTGSNSTIESEEERALRQLTTAQVQQKLLELTKKTIPLVVNTQTLNQSIESIETHLNENKERIKHFKKLAHLTCTVVEVMPGEGDEIETTDGHSHTATVSNKNTNKPSNSALIIRTAARTTYFTPNTGLVPADGLTPGTLVAVNPESLLVMNVLPKEFDVRVKAMEVTERPTDTYGDVGGLDKQIQELIEAIVLPVTNPEKFTKIGIKSPKGVLLYGPPGTGKTTMARVMACESKATFIRLAGTQLTQMYIGEGAKLVRDAFTLARQKAPAIIFVDEIDAVGAKRSDDTAKSGGREAHRTLMEILNQLDGFQQDENIKVIGATNRPDILDPALMRSGRLDRKIELPAPDEAARATVIRIHARRMNTHPDVNYAEIARCTEDFNAAQCRAVAVEAGMIALRRGATVLTHEDFLDACMEIRGAHKEKLAYLA